MPRMLTLWLDYGAELQEIAKKTHDSKQRSRNELALDGMRTILGHLNKVFSVQGTVDLWSYIMPVDRYSHTL